MTPNQLKKLRIKLGLTQEQFGTALGYSTPKIRVSELENGKTPITKQVEIICKYIEKFGLIKQHLD